MMNEEKWPKVAIILLNWNGWRNTIECLESLYQISYSNYEVIVVDNGSKDESIQKIKDYCNGKIAIKSKFVEYKRDNKPVKIIEHTREESEVLGKYGEIFEAHSSKKLMLIKNEKNYGFPEGNNIGLRYAIRVLNPKYIMLLNNDTIVDRRFLDRLVRVLEKDESIGIIGPKMLNSDGTMQFSCWKYHSFINVFNQEILLNVFGNFYKYRNIEKLKDVDVVSGACMLFRGTVFEKIGLMDSNIFMYSEETDICYRAKNIQVRVIYNPCSKIIHYGGQSSKKVSQDALIQSYRSKIYFFHKHYDKKKASILEIFLIGGLVERILFYKLLNIFVNDKKIKDNLFKSKNVLIWYKKEGYELKSLLKEAINNKSIP